jgi:uncharacterized repeat protein (TIGR03803 family)
MLRHPGTLISLIPSFLTLPLKSTHARTALVLFGVSAIPAYAQTFTIIGNVGTFSGTMNHFGALVPGADGSLYGTTGASVFKITLAGQLTTVYRSPALGKPEGGLLRGTDGNFYGTSSATPDTVFKITPAGQFTILHTFDRTDGQAPYGGVIQATDGNFYGTTSGGGPKNGGTVFKITPDGTLTTLHSFGSTPNDGVNPMAGLLQARDGNFYGTTSGGGANRMGTVFKITPQGTLTILHTFGDTDGRGPYAKLVQAADGNFYGTTGQGGATPPKGFAGGTVFRMTPNGTLTTLYTFVRDSPGVTDGYEPFAALVQISSGDFYGTTNSGGIGNAGTVFKITPLGTLTTIHKFIAATEGNIPAGLVQGPDGNLYGTTFIRVYRLAFSDTAAPPTSTKSGSGTVSGTWTIQTRGGYEIWGKTVGANITTDTMTLELKQDGTALTGTITTYRTGARKVTETKPISNAQLDGDNLSFDTVGEFIGRPMMTHYVGKLDGDTIHFTVNTGRGRGSAIDAHRSKN